MHNIRINYKLLICLLVYVGLCSLGLLFQSNDIYTNVYVRDVIVICSPLIIFIHKLKFSEIEIKFLFWTSVIAYFSWVGIAVIPHLNLSINLLTGFNSSNEWGAGVFTGMFFIYFLYKRSYLYLFFSLILILLVSKRSIFLGLLPALFAYLLFKNLFTLKNGMD